MEGASEDGGTRGIDCDEVPRTCTCRYTRCRGEEGRGRRGGWGRRQAREGRRCGSERKRRSRDEEQSVEGVAHAALLLTARRAPHGTAPPALARAPSLSLFGLLCLLISPSLLASCTPHPPSDLPDVTTVLRRGVTRCQRRFNCMPRASLPSLPGRRKRYVLVLVLAYPGIDSGAIWENTKRSGWVTLITRHKRMGRVGLCLYRDS
jgi:hypothetical protein